MQSTSPAWTDDFPAVDPEFQRPVQDVSELFVVVAVLGDDAAFFQQHSRHHNLLTNDELPLQERIQFFERLSCARECIEVGPCWPRVW